MDTHRPHATIRGFSLIEVAVALFIITLVMGGIIAMVNAMVANRQIESTRTKQEAIKTALISFIARNHRLPCPAIPTLADNAIDADTNVREGAEARTPGTCDKTVGSADATSLVVTGVVPWASLGLPQEVALDAYANRLTYQVVKSATALNSKTVSGMIGRISIHSTGPGVPGVPPTGNQINDCSAGAPTNPCAAVVVIVSHGKDSYGAYTRSGAWYQFDASIADRDARENADNDAMFVVKDYSEAPSNPFDDVVMWLTANDLLSSLRLNPTVDLNSAFESAKNTVVLTAINAKETSVADTFRCVSTCDSPLYKSCERDTSRCTTP
ncbi:MAG: prepilin-type N-terminal cleavage/methylation domain-containing protein, partial [Burkholderiales bacterium]|nr:prepilin-type N-terminal cleavage/methylation domain-containing protein [Burkholderiales bacterium]